MASRAHRSLQSLFVRTRIDSCCLAPVVLDAGARMFGAPIPFKRIGRFELLRILGEGASSAVYEAFDEQHDRRVALKMLKKSRALGEDTLAREFAIGAHFTHPNIVRYYDFVHEDGVACFTMEPVYGTDLLDFVWHAERPQRRASVRVDEARLRGSLVQLCSALLTLHACQTAHCDVKPNNVLVTAQGRVVLLDFELAASFLVGDQVAAHAGSVLGTPAYMPPEQFGVPQFTFACDWYAVGGTLFHAFVGRAPFENGDSIHQTWERKLNSPPPRPSDFVAGVPPDLDELCSDLLRANPYERPAGAEVIERLVKPSVHGPRRPFHLSWKRRVAL